MLPGLPGDAYFSDFVPKTGLRIEKGRRITAFTAKTLLYMKFGFPK